jgi:hypothetical protein
MADCYKNCNENLGFLQAEYFLINLSINKLPAQLSCVLVVSSSKLRDFACHKNSRSSPWMYVSKSLVIYVKKAGTCIGSETFQRHKPSRSLLPDKVKSEFYYTLPTRLSHSSLCYVTNTNLLRLN